MKIFLVAVSILIGLYVIFLLYFLSKTKSPVKMFFLYGLISAIVFAIINLTSFATGIYIPLNYGTAIGCAVGGVPFLILTLLLNCIFML